MAGPKFYEFAQLVYPGVVIVFNVCHIYSLLTVIQCIIPLIPGLYNNRTAMKVA